MPDRHPTDPIADVHTIHLPTFADERGNFGEFFRQEWFPEVSWKAIQINRSVSKAGVLRGLHYHFNQVDYWLLLDGRIRVGLADLRRSSPTFGTGATLEVDANNPTGIFIPSGVAHGMLALTDITLMYVVNQYYDGGTDENGVAWDDPDLNVQWNATDPQLSDRDRANPRFADIPPAELPE